MHYNTTQVFVWTSSSDYYAIVTKSLSFIYRSDVNKTCPICRDEIHGHKDYWEVPEPPSKTDIGNFVLGMAEGAGDPT